MISHKLTFKLVGITIICLIVMYVKLKSYLSCDGGVGFIEKGPHLRLELLPPRESSLVVRLLETEFPSQFLLGGLLGVEIQPVEDRQRFLRIPMLQGRRGEEGGKRDKCNNDCYSYL